MVLYCGKSLAHYSARCCKVDVPVLWQMFFPWFLKKKKMFLIIFLFFEFIFKLFLFLEFIFKIFLFFEFIFKLFFYFLIYF